jgi:hypothetical protein
MGSIHADPVDNPEQLLIQTRAFAEPSFSSGDCLSRERWQEAGSDERKLASSAAKNNVDNHPAS